MAEGTGTGRDACGVFGKSPLALHVRVPLSRLYPPSSSPIHGGLGCKESQKCVAQKHSRQRTLSLND